MTQSPQEIIRQLRSRQAQRILVELAGMVEGEPRLTELLLKAMARIEGPKRLPRPANVHRISCRDAACNGKCLL